MVNKRETVQSLMDSVQQGDFGNARAMLADDFQFSGPLPEPIGAAEAWVGLAKPREPRGIAGPMIEP
jgi:hypothetical protein